MKSLRHLSALSWLVMFAGAAAFPLPSLGHNEKFVAQELSKSDPPCPTISVTCPTEIVDYGKPITFTATVSGDPGIVHTYNWSVSVGTIIEGQGTPTIKVNIEGTAGQAYSATLAIGGLSPTCPATASCSMIFEHLPIPTRFDSYSRVPSANEMTRLKAYAVYLESQPGVRGYVLVYGARRGRAGEAQRVATRSKNYLIKTRRIEPRRVVAVDAGIKESLTIDLWLVPEGASPPSP